MIRRLLLAFAVLFSTISVAIWSTGGFATSVAGARVSARSPGSAAIAAVLALTLWFVAARRARAVRGDVNALDGWIDRRATAIVSGVAALAGATSVRFNTFSASGSDPSGYLSEAAMLASGALSYLEPLVQSADWNDAARTLAPLGWQAAHGVTQVPTYAVGLPLLMAMPHAAGGAVLATLVVCASAALAVWFAGRLAIHMGGGSAGVLAAVLFATIPVQLYESMQPMSDVPVTAAWLACWCGVSTTVGRSPGPRSTTATLLAGIAAAVAALIRPNLAPLAALPALIIWMRTRRHDRVQVLWFAAPVATAGIAIAYLHWRWFGSPLRSGYGSASEIYSLTNVGPNTRLYFEWLFETSGAWLLAAPLALAVRSRPLLRWLLAFVALACAAYFAYGTFETWPYLRFLLPALSLACVVTAAFVAHALKHLPSTPHPLLVITLVLAIGGLQIKTARDLEVFTLPARQARALLAGHYLAAAAPADAVLITGEQSGAMRYYTGRSIVRWDLLRTDMLLQVHRQLEGAGRELWIVLDDWEVALFRDEFRSTPYGGLDWPPVMEAGSHGQTQAWRMRDREAFLAGGRILTDSVR